MCIYFKSEQRARGWANPNLTPPLVCLLLMWAFWNDFFVDIIEFLICKKWLGSLSSLVNISAKLTFPSMCLIITFFLWTFSLIAFSLIWIWRSPFVVRLPDQHIHALLSLYKTVGCFRTFLCNGNDSSIDAVSYTHLTLPTMRTV